MHLGCNAPAVDPASNHTLASNAAPLVKSAAGAGALHHADSTILAGLGSHDASSGLTLAYDTAYVVAYVVAKVVDCVVAYVVSKRQVRLDLSVGSNTLEEEDDAYHHHKKPGEVQSVHLVWRCLLKG